jgi:hypothetical protein
MKAGESLFDLGLRDVMPVASFKKVVARVYTAMLM